MLPRTESMFNIQGEEGIMVNEERSTNKSTGSSTLTARSRGSLPECLVGLRILIQHHRHTTNNIVVKSALRPRSPRSLVPKSGFLKACFFCRRELSLQKEVYMYRGDQGFCSVECRCQQILLDERREFEASKRAWQRMQHRQCATPNIRSPNRKITLWA